VFFEYIPRDIKTGDKLKDKSKNKNLIAIWIITVALILVTALLTLFFITYSRSLSMVDEMVSYDKYYVMIADDPLSSLWQDVHRSAKEAAKENNAYVEMFSDRLYGNYSKYELMEIAISSGVDGIIVSADESDEMTKLINKAKKKGIPVVTIFSDNTKSERISFVGVGNYNLGREYGKLISEISKLDSESKNELKVTVLMDSVSGDSGQNVLFAAIGEAINYDAQVHPYTHTPISLSLFSVDSTNNFSVEESVRELLQEKDNLPNVVVCLNEVDTTSVYQSVVDYNEVGEVTILGYYDSEAILKGIERNVIYSTISVDTNQMGELSVEALNEYYEMGNTSQYFAVDVSIINKSNVYQHFKEGTDNEE